MSTRYSGMGQINALLGDMVHDLNLAANPVASRSFRDAAGDAFGQSENDAWNTFGTAIGSVWPTDLIETGDLKDSLVNTYSMIVVGDTLRFGSTVQYSSYLDDRYGIIGWTSMSMAEIGQALVRMMETEGRLEWQ